MDFDTFTTEAIELLQQLIAIPRTSRQESAAADFFAHSIEKMDLDVHREANNLWVIGADYDAQLPTLLLNAHIDTVRPVSGWQRDPFTPTLEGDRLYGLGANDDGASLVALLQAFRIVTSRAQAYNLVYMASAEEEIGGHDGIERALPLLPHIDVALVGEPTGMQPAIAEKGLMVLDVTATGLSGHAARNEGINAIYRALPDIEWLRTHHFERVSPLLGDVKTTVTVINAGTQHNVVPDSCAFTVDVRTTECYTNEEVFDIISEALSSDVKAHSFRLQPSHIDPSHPLVQSALTLGATLDGRPRTPFGSPTLSDQALMPWPSMKMGPGDSARSHTADEYIRLPELRAAIEEYVRLLDGLRL